MDKRKELFDSDNSNAVDSTDHVDLLQPVNLVADQSELNQTLEDKNRNITLKSKGTFLLDGKQLSTSTSSKDKPNVVGLHVGPNGLINGLEIENSASLSHLLENIPKTEMHQSLCKPSSSHNNTKTCSSSSGQCLKDSSDRPSSSSTNIRTELVSVESIIGSGDSLPTDVPISLGSCAQPDLPKPSISDVQSQAASGHNAECDGNENQESDVQYVSYKSELQMPDIMRLIQKDLSEPYSIYTYRYFIHNWPKLCFLAMDGKTCVGAIVCKLDIHRKVVKRGYIAMLAVDEKYRKRKIGSNLVLKAIRAMVADDADEVVLETEITNRPALRLYENLGFVRDKRLFRYYLNGVDALRLKLWLR